MNRYLIVFYLIFIHFLSFSQIEFEETPMDLQFFQRDANSKAIISFSGKVNQPNFEKITLETYRNGVLFNTNSQNIIYQNNQFQFQFKPEIKAELANYDFKLILSNSKASEVVLEKKRIIAGETILMYGQSNAQATVENENYEFFSEWGRTVNVYDIPNKQGYWVDFQTFSNNINGVFATEIAKNLIEKEKIPVCLINGAEGLKSITDLSIRNDTNPQDWNTIYGKFMTEISFANLLKSARILIWRQGENEAFDPPIVKNYPSNFDKFRKNLKMDLPSLQKIYVIQNNILTFQSSNASELRDFQRNFKNVYSDVESIASVGTAGHDGLHYNKAGYIQSGLEVSRLIQRDFFDKTQSKEINSPDIKKALFTTQKDSIIFFFEDESVRMIIENDLKLTNGKTRSMKDFFYLDGKDGQVFSVSADKNKIILKLTEPSKAKTINYLPHYFADWTSTGFYNGPFIKNSLGMRAFSFANIQIEEPPILSNEIGYYDAMFFFPNPIIKGANGFLSNPNSTISKLNIYSETGVPVLEFSPQKTELIEIPTEKLNLGVYLMNIRRNDGSNLTLKFIVQ
jgi:hypothetical protein